LKTILRWVGGFSPSLLKVFNFTKQVSLTITNTNTNTITNTNTNTNTIDILKRTHFIRLLTFFKQNVHIFMLHTIIYEMAECVLFGSNALSFRFSFKWC